MALSCLLPDGESLSSFDRDSQGQLIERDAGAERSIYPAVQSETQTGGGHLFQGRYKAIIVEKDSYLLSLCGYVA